MEEARKKPGTLTFTSTGPLTAQHIFMEAVALKEHIKITHLPVQGDPEFISQILGGHVDGGLGAPVLPYIRSGKLRGLGVTCEKRSDLVPNIPTFAEIGYDGVSAANFLGIIGPKGIDPKIIQKLQNAFKIAYGDPSFKQMLHTFGMVPTYRDGDSFRQLVLRNLDEQRKILKTLKLIK